MDKKYSCVTRNVQTVGHDGGSIYDVHKVFMALQMVFMSNVHG